MKYCQLVVGPAGSGKSTYCNTIQEHCKIIGRTVFVVNLDPAAETFKYDCAVELISVDDVMEDDELKLGPNGALVYCMEYLTQNLDWLHEELNEAEDDYFLFDCPVIDKSLGQIELYSHLSVMKEIVEALQLWGFNICSTFILDTTFCLDADKFIAAALTTLSTMVALETPAINVLSKIDLLSPSDRESLDTFLDGNIKEILDSPEIVSTSMPNNSKLEKWNKNHRKLTESIGAILQDYSLVKFVPLEMEDEDSITELLLVIDTTIQYGEDLDVKDRLPEEEDNDEINQEENN